MFKKNHGHEFIKIQPDTLTLEKTKETDLLLQQLFPSNVLKNLGHESRIAKTRRRISAQISGFNALVRITKMTFIAVNTGTYTMSRVELAPVENKRHLLRELNKFIFLKAPIEMIQPGFSRKQPLKILEEGEHFHNAISIPANDFLVFVAKKYRMPIPQFADQSAKIKVLGIYSDCQPTALVFWFDGRRKRRKLPPKQHKLPRRLQLKPSF